MKTKGENYKLELRIINSEKLESYEYKDFGLHIKKISTPHDNLLENKFTHITVKFPVGILYFLLEKKITILPVSP